MVRCGSIYDNYNCDTSTLFDPLPEEDEADEENSVVLHIDDDDTIENDIQGTGFLTNISSAEIYFIVGPGP